MRGKRVGSRPSAAPYLQKVANILGMDVAFGEAEKDLCYFGAVPFGSAILTKGSLEDVSRIVMTSTDEDALLGDQARDFAESRGAISATICVGGRRITVATTHLDHKSEDLRAKQMTTALASLGKKEKGQTILCGDFNTFQRKDYTPESWDRIVDFYGSRGWATPRETSLVLDGLSSRGWRDAAENDVPYPTPTCWTATPLFRIDYVWLSPDLSETSTVTNYSRVDDDASDHFPVSVDLLFSEPPEG